MEITQSDIHEFIYNSPTYNFGAHLPNNINEPRREYETIDNAQFKKTDVPTDAIHYNQKTSISEMLSYITNYSPIFSKAIYPTKLAIKDYERGSINTYQIKKAKQEALFNLRNIVSDNVLTKKGDSTSYQVTHKYLKMLQEYNPTAFEDISDFIIDEERSEFLSNFQKKEGVSPCRRKIIMPIFLQIKRMAHYI